MPFLRGGATKPFRLTYGTVPPDHRGGGTSETLMEGYASSSPPDTPYRYFLRVTSSAEKTYPLFVALSDLVDSDCMAMLEVHESEAVVTYEATGFSKERILRALEPFAFRLVNDGQTGFGLASRNFEVFVGDHKDVRVFSQDLARTRSVLKSFDIGERRNLRFLETGPHYHIPIVVYFEDERIAELGEPLPAEEREKYRQAAGTYGAFHQSIIGQLEMKVQGRTGPT